MLKIFDNKLKQKQRARALKIFNKKEDLDNYLLLQESANRLAENITEEAFYRDKTFSKTLNISPFYKNENKQNSLDFILPLIKNSISEENYQYADLENIKYLKEESLALPENEFDLIISQHFLHWVNDLPGVLLQIKQALKTDGIFIANFIGGKSLCELREIINKTDLEYKGGVSARISPMIHVKDAGTLLQKVNFKDPISYAEIIKMEYEDVFTLIQNLRNNAENNALIKRTKHFPDKEYFELLNKNFKKSKKLITFEIITLLGKKN